MTNSIGEDTRLYLVLEETENISGEWVTSPIGYTTDRRKAIKTCNKLKKELTIQDGHNFYFTMINEIP